MIKIIRENKSKDSTVIVDKRILQDQNLSWEAKGVMAYLQTLPEDVSIESQELTHHFNDTQETIEAALKELVKHGYLEKETD